MTTSTAPRILSAVRVHDLALVAAPLAPKPLLPPANLPGAIAAEVGSPLFDELAGLYGDPTTYASAPSADELIARSYVELERKHAKDRARDELGRFVPKLDTDQAEHEADDQELDEGPTA